MSVASTSTPASPPAAPRALPRWGVRAAGTILFASLVASRLDLGAVGAAWRGLAAPEVLLVAAAFVAAMVVRVVKWAWQLRRLGVRFERRSLARDLLLGVLLGAVTPARVGELYRLRALAPDARPVAAASLVLEKLCEVAILVALVGAGLAGSQPLAGGLLLAAVVAVVWLGVSAVTTPLLRRLPSALRVRVVAPALRARDGLGGAGLLGLLSLTSLAHALNLLGALGVYRAFGDVSAWTLAARLPLVTLSNALPLSLGGVGIREATAMAALGGDGLPPSSAALAASVVFLGANVLPAALLLGLLPLAKAPDVP